MSLDSSLSIAASGLLNINAQLGVVSNNVANASTPDYSVETPNQVSLIAGPQPLGVRTEATTRSIDLALQQSLYLQDSTVSGLRTTTTGLQSLDALQGTPGQGNDLGSLLANVQSAFSVLLGDPSSPPLQTAVLSAASNLSAGINSLSNAYTQQRQTAQSGIVAAVANVNTELSQIGDLNNQIIGAQVAGHSTADLENQRDAAVHALSTLISVKTLIQPTGNMIVSTVSGTQLPTARSSSPLQVGNTSVGPNATHANGAIPGVMLQGVDITNQLQGGSLGANIALRDSTLPTFQGELDEFAYSLASRFSGQGLTLFSDANGNVPAGGGVPAQSTYVGFASEVQINPLVAVTPSLVRDGTKNIGNSLTGPSGFTTNPAGGPAGFTGLITRILNFALGANAQPGAPQQAGNTTGLGPDGTLSAPYSAPATLADNATSLISAQEAVSATASNQLSTEQAVQATLTKSLNTVSGVNMDTEMSHMIELENAYGANARVISTVQVMFTQLLQSVQ